MKFLLMIFIAMLVASCQFFVRHPDAGQSYYQIKWNQALMLLKEQNFDEAESVLKELYQSALGHDPQISTAALFELGQISEKKGLWYQALAQFKECESKKNELPGYKADLELPSRLAGLYATLGELKISENYAKKVASNIQMYMQQMSLVQQKVWWAETYFRMGSFPVKYINADNWKDFALRFHSTSQYLIRSMEFSDPIWSERSLELSQSFFKKSFEFLSVGPSDLEENTVLLGVLVRDRINLLEEIIQKIQLYKPLDMKTSRSVWLFYQSVEDYSAKLKSQLYQIKDSAPLSLQSQKKNALERDGELISPKKSDKIDNNKTDPNL